MTSEQLLAKVKLIYGSDIPFTDSEITGFLDLASQEVINYQYSLIGVPTTTPDTSEYDMVKVMAVIFAFTQHGAEGESGHTEGSYSRQFVYKDMIDYIHKNVIPFTGVGR